jgi:hypothetical protein
MRRAVLLSGMLGFASLLFGAGKAALPMRAAATAQQPITPPAKKETKLTEQNKILILREVDGDFVRVVRPLPSIKSGFQIKPDGKVDEEALQSALMRSLPAAKAGERVQITGIEFHRKSIRVNINGGSHPHKSLRQRIHFSVGLPIPTAQVIKEQPQGLVKVGSTLVVEFGQPVPNITPAQLEKYLSPFLSFADGRSASQIWVDSLPPKFKNGIANHQAVVGMDRTMVLAALGRPGHKVRDFSPTGVMTEDWIYGRPPGKTVFVTFLGDQVIRVKMFP